jgi:hypothetical protein
MTNGEKLKIDLGLSNFQYVKIRRLISKTAAPIYQIFYNSRFPDRPLTVNFLNSNEFIPFVVKDDEKLYGTPFIDIERWLGEPKGKVFIATDIAGTYGRKNNYDFIYESKDKVQFRYFLGKSALNEFVTLPALRDKQANLTSNLTKQYKNIRKDLIGTANKNTKLTDTVLEEDNVTFKFTVESTPDGSTKKKVNPLTFEISDNPSEKYSIWLKFLNVTDWLGAFDEKETITQKDIKDMIDICNIQIWDNNPSFHWMGANWGLSQIDASIFPTSIEPKLWGPKHGGAGNYMFSKHLSQVIDQMGFFRNQMASALTNVLRKEGLLPKYRR